MGFKKLLFLSVMLSLVSLAAACSSDDMAANSADFIKWDSRTYESSPEIIPDGLIGESLGSVQLQTPIIIPKCTSASQLETGAEFFKINGYSQNSYIAILVDGDFFLYKTRDSESICFGKSCPDQDEDIEKSQAEAYFLIFEYLFQTDSALHRNIKYIAVDLSDTMLENTDCLISLLENFCTDNDCVLLLDTIDGLREKGYIKDLYFEEGIVIRYNDILLKDNWLTTEAMKWRAGLGAIGATITVKKTGGIWEIRKTEKNWISQAPLCNTICIC